MVTFLVELELKCVSGIMTVFQNSLFYFLSSMLGAPSV